MLHTDRAGPKKGIVCKLPGVRRDVVILIARELQSLNGRGTGHPHSQGATVLEATVLEGEGNAPTSTQNMHKPPEYPIMDQTESGKRVTGILRERGLFSQVDPLQGGHATACMSEDMRLVKHSFGDGPLVDSQTSPLQREPFNHIKESRRRVAEIK